MKVWLISLKEPTINTLNNTLSMAKQWQNGFKNWLFWDRGIIQALNKVMTIWYPYPAGVEVPWYPISDLLSLAQYWLRDSGNVEVIGMIHWWVCWLLKLGHHVEFHTISLGAQIGAQILRVVACYLKVHLSCWQGLLVVQRPQHQRLVDWVPQYWS